MAYTAVNPVDVKFVLDEGSSARKRKIIPGWDVAEPIVCLQTVGLKEGDSVYALTRPAFDMLRRTPHGG
jgi:NADPH:quinone reductase-like Zn-dependent oxidoreductase